MRIKKLLIFIILMAVSVYAGEYVDAFLEGGITARAVAMANTLGCLDFSATANLSNPAGLGYLKRSEVGVLYASQFGLANYSFIYAGFPISKNFGVATSWIRFGVDDIPIRPDLVRDITDKEIRRDTIIFLHNKPVKTFGDVENAFLISFGKYNQTIVDLGWRYSKFWMEYPWGVNFKIIHKRLYNLRGFGLGMDWGGRLKVNGEEMLAVTGMGDISLGLVFQDILGTTIYWNTKSQDRIRPATAWSFAFEQPIPALKSQINFGWSKFSRYNDKSSYGIEYNYNQCIFFRLGLKKSGINSGIGLNFKMSNRLIKIDYAFYKHELGMNHRVGCAVEL